MYEDVNYGVELLFNAAWILKVLVLVCVCGIVVAWIVANRRSVGKTVAERRRSADEKSRLRDV